MIVFVHLLNDCSGSPRVLCSSIGALAGEGEHFRLFVGSGGSGCLDDTGVETSLYWYRRTPFRVLTLVTYMVSQFCLLVRLLFTRDIDRDALIYVNTILPFGAALYGWMTRRPVVYHLHEVSVSPAPLKWFLTTIVRLTAQCLIYVSGFHRSCLPISAVPAKIVYNALSETFLYRARANVYRSRRDACFNVLMLASLRDYKGVPEFLALANQLVVRPDIRFNLVVNDDEAAIRRYFRAIAMPPNVTIHARTDDPTIHYAKASLVLNLSRPDQWVESFGMTLLEAMAFGIPVIAPPVGGPVELVDDGYDGYLIDSRNKDELVKKLLQFADDEVLCMQFSETARRKSALFSPDIFARSLRDALNLSAT